MGPISATNSEKKEHWTQSENSSLSAWLPIEHPVKADQTVWSVDVQAGLC